MTDKVEQLSIVDLLAIMDALRDPEHGCPWDLAQDFSTIAPHTLEEVHEVIDAIERGRSKELAAELGDLLFQVVFYARLGKERGDFDFEDIASGICRKLLRRHPHVFPDGTLASAGTASGISPEEVTSNWERIKHEERQQGQVQPASVLDDVPLALGALSRAAKLQKRAAMQGFDWPDSLGVVAKVHEELAELEAALDGTCAEAIAEEFGDLMFTMVNLGRHLRLDPETALRRANSKFEGRFRAMEAMARKGGREVGILDTQELEALWNKAKQKGARGSET
jgi:nucleoside triphosphate diphosphatase